MASPGQKTSQKVDKRSIISRYQRGANVEGKNLTCSN